jgi:S1-C subfamily serine protease
VIVQVDGKTVTDASTLSDALLSKDVGQQVSLKIYRGNQQMTINVTLGELQAQNS